MPELKEKIEQNIEIDVIKDPYMLYETEYDDYIEKEAANNIPEFVRGSLPEEEAARRLETHFDKNMETELQK